MKNIIKRFAAGVAFAMLSIAAFAQSYPSPTYNVLTLQTPLGYASGGTNATTAIGATNNLQYLQGATGSAARSVTNRLQDGPALLDFAGADPTGATSSDTAWNNFIAAVMSSHKCGHINAGTYKLTASKVIDLASISPVGICLYGDGQYSSMLDMSGVTSGPVMAIYDTGNAGGGAFYSSFSNFGIKCNVAGICLQLGHNDDSDALNEFEFRNIWVGNNSTSSSAIGIQVNYVLNTHFFAVIAANNGHGDAWQLNAAAFNDWIGGSGTYADNGFHLTANSSSVCNCGTIAGNTFIGLDLEENSVNHIKIDTANAHDNAFIGGTMVYAIGSQYGVYASAGSNNTFSNVFLNTSGGTAAFSNFFNGTNNVGVALINMFGATFGLQTGNPSFSAYMSANQTLTSGTWTQLHFDSTSFSNGGAFNTGSYSFVAPWGGRFEFRCVAPINATNGSNAVAYVGLYKNGSTARSAGIGIPSGTNFEAPQVSATLVLSQSDTVSCYASIPASSGSPVVQGTSTNAYFEGRYIGP